MAGILSTNCMIYSFLRILFSNALQKYEKGTVFPTFAGKNRVQFNLSRSQVPKRKTLF
jgi:hypothetical protein